MIADYQNDELKDSLLAPRLYGLGQTHKHLPEMMKVCNLNTAPVFCPIVSSYYAGMEVVVPLSKSQVSASLDEIKQIYKNYYTGDIVKYVEASD